MMEDKKAIRKIRIWILFFIFALLISGITAFPVLAEIKILNKYLGMGTAFASIFPTLSAWFDTVYEGIVTTDKNAPFIFYGTDWLAYAHISIAIGFIGPYREPVRNKWFIDFGIICCLLIIPTALICGPIRGIPFWWRLIDCSFGIFGLIPLLIVKQKINKLEIQIMNN